MKKNKIVQFECPNCHSLFPEYVERPVFNADTSTLEVARMHPQRCDQCGTELQRRVRKK